MQFILRRSCKSTEVEKRMNAHLTANAAFETVFWKPLSHIRPSTAAKQEIPWLSFARAELVPQ